MPRIRFYTGLFLIAACTLMLQIIQTRVLSVVSWYHLAFFAISMAMFGLAAGGIWVHRGGSRFSSTTTGRDLSYYGSLFALAITICFAIQMSLALQSPGLPVSASNLWSWSLLALCMCVPFFFAGVVITLALTRSGSSIGRTYAVNLAGAAAGCLMAVALLHVTDGPTAILWVAAIAGTAAWAFPGRPGDAPDGRELRLAKTLTNQPLWALLLIAIAYINGITDRGLQPLVVKDETETADKYVFREWNSFSRIAVNQPAVAQRPRLWGPSPLLTDTYEVRQALMNIDGITGSVAFEFSGNFDDVEFLKLDVTNLAYFLPDRQKAAIIGVGGGRDILSAAMLGITDIAAIEINPIFVELLTEIDTIRDFSQVAAIPGVRFETDEARSWLARSEERFQIIQMSMIDSWAATNAGAFTLSENGLYTLEAWSMFLDRLTTDGVFTVSRWYSPDNLGETGRMLSLAVATLLKRGIRYPAQHVFLASQNNRVATLVLSRSPLTEEDIGSLTDTANTLQHSILLSPARRSESETLRRIINSRSLVDLAAATDEIDLDMTPPSDDRPFFFNQLPLDNPLRALRVASVLGAWPAVAKGVVTGNLAATSTLIILFTISTLLVLATIVLPVRAATRNVGTPLVAGGTLCFMLIGTGFMMIEIGLLQRTSIFLGEPVYALSIILFTLIAAAGTGSLCSEWLLLDTWLKFAGWAAGTALYVLLIPVWAPALMGAFEDGGLMLRALISITIAAPTGLLMGLAFPSIMRIVNNIDPRPAPWFVGINASASVLATTVAVATSIASGISTTITVGAICYAMLIPASLLLMRPGRSTSADAIRPTPATDRGSA